MPDTETSSEDIMKLKELDNLLKCGICYEYMKTTLITPCSHNYCSYCIRQSLSYRTQCPSCFENLNESQLRTNRIVDEFILIFLGLKEKLQTFLSTLPSTTENYRDSLESNEKSIDERDNKENIIKSNSVSSSLESNAVKLFNDGNSSIKSQPSTSMKEVHVPSMFSPKKSKPTVGNVVKVPCPVCKVEIPEKNINFHLDACLKRSEEKRVLRNVKKKHLPKFVYHLLPDKELRKKLNELGLSTSGDRTTLINRHKRYIVLYNSECDSLEPRPVSEIIKQLKKEEEEEKKLSPQSVKKLNVDRKADPQTNEEAQREYLQEHKSSFDKLVKEARRNQVTKRKMSAENCNKNIITIDDSSQSEDDFQINRRVSNRSLIKSDSENETNEYSEESPRINTQVSIHQERDVAEETVYTSSCESKESSKTVENLGNMRDTKSESNLQSIYDCSTDEIETDDDTMNDVSQIISTSGRKKISNENQTPLKNCTDSNNTLDLVKSPVFSSKIRLHLTPKNSSGHKTTVKRDLGRLYNSPKVSVDTANQERDEDFVDSDSSSNHSTSLMTYTGPDLESGTPLHSPLKSPSSSPTKPYIGSPTKPYNCTPTKPYNCAPTKPDPSSQKEMFEEHSPINKSFSNAQNNFNFGIDNMLENSEEFVPVPVARKSARIKQNKRNGNTPETNSRAKRKRVRIDDL